MKLGSLGFGFGAEKNDESDLESLTVWGAALLSFFTTTGLEDDAEETAAFFVGCADFDAGGSALRFLAEGMQAWSIDVLAVKRTDMTHPADLRQRSSPVRALARISRAIYVLSLMPCP